MDHILGVLFNDDVEVPRPHTYVTYVHIYTKHAYFYLANGQKKIYFFSFFFWGTDGGGQGCGGEWQNFFATC